MTEYDYIVQVDDENKNRVFKRRADTWANVIKLLAKFKVSTLLKTRKQTLLVFKQARRK